MKKLMIAAAIVCAAVVANASAFNWSNSGGASSYKVYDKTGTALTEGTVAYLLCTTDISQDNFLKGVRGAANVTTYVTSKAISGANNAVNSNSKIPALASTFDYGTDGSSYSFYYAIIKGDDILISATADATATKGTTSSIAFKNSSTWSQVNNGTGAYSAAGWYATATTPTPEPTSAMLLLLGVAGLALKRKQK